MNNTKELDFRDYLQGEFLQRCRKNPRYSLRAYAKTLRIDHSTLSQILRGKRNLTRKAIVRLAESLHISDAELNSFLQAFDKNGGKMTEYQSMSLDMYTIIGDWYHFAIFELVTLRHFKQDYAWIATRLGLEVKEVEQAVDRLMRVGLLKTDEEGRWRQSASNLTTINNDFTAAAFRNAQKTKLGMAAHALENVPFEKRDNSAIMMAINTKKIPEAKRRIKEFRRELCEWLQKDANRDAVYEMVSAFYPITQLEEL